MNSDDLESRTTPLGLFHYAHSYAASANALVRCGVKSTHPEAPIRYLFGHAIELYLKSFLLLRGTALDELRERKFGHNLSALLERVMTLGLSVSESMVKQIDLANNDVLGDRYIKTGFKQVLGFDEYAAICAHLNAQIGPSVYAAAGLCSSPPALDAILDD